MEYNKQNDESNKKILIPGLSPQRSEVKRRHARKRIWASVIWLVVGILPAIWAVNYLANAEGKTLGAQGWVLYPWFFPALIYAGLASRTAQMYGERQIRVRGIILMIFAIAATLITLFSGLAAWHNRPL